MHYQVSSWCDLRCANISRREFALPDSRGRFLENNKNRKMNLCIWRIIVANAFSSASLVYVLILRLCLNLRFVFETDHLFFVRIRPRILFVSLTPAEQMSVNMTRVCDVATCLPEQKVGRMEHFSSTEKLAIVTRCMQLCSQVYLEVSRTLNNSIGENTMQIPLYGLLRHNNTRHMCLVGLPVLLMFQSSFTNKVC